MMHDYDDRFWAENHQTLSDGIDRGLAVLARGFRHLHASMFFAPWRRRGRPGSPDCGV